MDRLLARLREEICDLLWDQWSALGVAGRASGKAVPFVVDPEALLLATMRFGNDDGRLVMEVMASDRRWHLVCRAFRRWLAHDAKRSSSLENLLPLLSYMGQTRNLGERAQSSS
jgi:hypothetical protein